MFANFADLEPFVKVFSANLKCVRPILSPRNLLFSHFRESFIPRKFPAIRYMYIPSQCYSKLPTIIIDTSTPHMTCIALLSILHNCVPV